jgi:hypothetical protein
MALRKIRMKQVEEIKRLNIDIMNQVEEKKKVDVELSKSLKSMSI